MPVKKKGGKKSSTIEVDMSGVEAGGKAVPDGTYTLEVAEVTEEESSEGNPYLKFVYSVADGPSKNARIYDNVSLQPQALWRFKTLLECFEIEVPDSAMEIELEDLVGKTVDVEITGEEYQGKRRPKITGFLGAGGEGGATGGGEEEEERKSSGKKTDDKKSKSKFKVGQDVKFKDDKKKTLEGTITAIDGDEVTVEVDGEEWELDASDLIV